MSKCKQHAVQLLSWREHSYYELQQKLIQRGYAPDEIVEALDALVAKDWLSDARFAESYLRMRAQKGYGPARITAELQQRGITQTLLQNVLHAFEWDWLASAEQALAKKAYMHTNRLQQKKYLSYRGFTMEIINKAVKETYETH